MFTAVHSTSKPASQVTFRYRFRQTEELLCRFVGSGKTRMANIWKEKLSPSKSAEVLQSSATVISQCLKWVTWPWKAGKEHLKPERKKSWLFFYSQHCYAANDYQQRNQRQECAHIHYSWRSWWGFASTAKLYLKRKFLLLIKISNSVPGFKWHSAYYSQQEKAVLNFQKQQQKWLDRKAPGL